MRDNRSYCKIVKSGKIIYCSDLSWRELVFRDRIDGGLALANLIKDLNIIKINKNTLIYGLAAGGIPVAYAVSKKLRVVFDIIVVKKILFPWTTEAGFGAVAPDGSFMYDRYVAHEYLGYSRDFINQLVLKTREFVINRTLRIRGSLEYSSLTDREVIVVDDGIATGYTMAVACIFLRKLGASKIVVASPTASSDGAKMVSEYADQIIIINLRNPPYAVADAYVEWYDLNDEDIISILNRASMEKLYRKNIKNI